MKIFHIIEPSDFWNVLSIMGYGKLILSIIKYFPVAYWNYKRKSTKGWPLPKMLLDFLGGLLSLISGLVSMENGFNFAKTGLAILTIAYNLVFFFQRFCLYRIPKKTAL